MRRMTFRSPSVAALSLLLLLTAVALPAQWGPPEESSETAAAKNEKIPLDERCQLWFGSFRTVFMSPEHFYDLAATLAGRAES